MIIPYKALCNLMHQRLNEPLDWMGEECEFFANKILEFDAHRCPVCRKQFPVTDGRYECCDFSFKLTWYYHPYYHYGISTDIMNVTFLDMSTTSSHVITTSPSTTA